MEEIGLGLPVAFFISCIMIWFYLDLPFANGFPSAKWSEAAKYFPGRSRRQLRQRHTKIEMLREKHADEVCFNVSQL